jgi:hypothetical protein
MATDVSTQIPDPSTHRPERRWETRAREQELAQTEAAALLEQMAASMGGILAFMEAPPVGDVLVQTTRIMPAAGFDTLQWKAVAQAITVANLSGQLMTVHADAPNVSGQAPPAGVGVFNVFPGIMRTVATRAHSITVYGAAGSVYDVTAYARPRDPSASAVVGDPSTLLNFQVLQPANPAAGADLVISPSPSKPWRPVALYATLTTNATAGLRQVALELTDAVPNVWLKKTVNGTQTVSLAYSYGWVAGGGSSDDPQAPILTTVESLLPELWLPAGTAVRTLTTNLQAGDQWSGLYLLYRLPY